jgi:hypothetical protein
MEKIKKEDKEKKATCFFVCLFVCFAILDSFTDYFLSKLVLCLQNGINLQLTFTPNTSFPP